MKKNVLFSVFYFVLFAVVFVACEDHIVAEEEIMSEEVVYYESEAWFNYLCSEDLGGRYSGSDGIKKAEKYICDIIGRGDSLQCDTFATSKGEMTNIIFHIEGKEDSLIVMGAHYDAYGYFNNTPYPGADDNMSGVAVLLELINMIKNSSFTPRYSLDICFFDGEEIGRYGSRHYIEQCERNIKFYINVDTCGSKEGGIEVLYSKISIVQEKLCDFIKEIKTEIKEYNPIGYATDCDPFLINNIPIISIQNDYQISYLHSKKDDISHISFEKLFFISKGLDSFLKTI